MKNFSHVYPSSKNPFPKKISSNKPPLNSTTNNSFGKNSSMRTFNHFNPIKSTHNIKAQRLSSKSIEQPHFGGYVEGPYGSNQKRQVFMVDNEEEDSQELFKESYRKIGMIRQNFNKHSQIDNQLNEILNLIREERLKVRETVQNMKKQLQTGKQNFLKQFKETAINTQQLIPCIDERSFEEKQIQTEENSENQEVSQPSKLKTEQVYTKLSIMLHDMGINSLDILPPHTPPQLQQKQYKKLSENQTIKIQKFLIKKLAEKVQK